MPRPAAKGEQYWREERRICALLLRHAQHAQAATSNAGGSTPLLTLAEVHAASEAKSFDYRVLVHHPPFVLAW